LGHEDEGGCGHLQSQPELSEPLQRSLEADPSYSNLFDSNQISQLGTSPREEML